MTDPHYTPNAAAVECATRAWICHRFRNVAAQEAALSGESLRYFSGQAEAAIVALVTEGHLTVPTEDHQTSLTMNDYKRAAEAQYDETMKAQAALADAVALLRRWHLSYIEEDDFLRTNADTVTFLVQREAATHPERFVAAHPAGDET